VVVVGEQGPDDDAKEP